MMENVTEATGETARTEKTCRKKKKLKIENINIIAVIYDIVSYAFWLKALRQWGRGIISQAAVFVKTERKVEARSHPPPLSNTITLTPKKVRSNKKLPSSTMLQKVAKILV